MLLCHAIDRDRSWHLSCNVCCMALHSSATDIDQGPNTLYPHAFGDVAALALSPSLVVRVAGGPHKERTARRQAPLEVQLEAPYYYAHLAHPHTDAANLTPSTNCRARMYCNPYCNGAGTHWYTMDKVIPPDHRKPPKQAQLADAPVQARTYASKLVKRRGQRFESARRLSKSADLQLKRR